MNGLEVFEKGYVARLTIPTDPIGATRRQVLEHSARTAVTAVASMLAARVLKLPQTYWAPITTMVITQSSLGATLAVSWRRFIGTAVGAALGASGGKSFRDVYDRIRRQRFPVGTILRRTANGSKRVSVRRRYAGDRFARSTSGACVAGCLSSIR